MKGARTRRGVALVTTVVMTGVVALLCAGVFGYVLWAVRASAAAVARDVCRLAAQSEIEIAKTAVNTAFVKSIERSARIVGGDTIGSTGVSSFDWFEAYSGPAAKRTIGARNGVTLDYAATNLDCVVKVRIGAVEHATGAQWADVTFVARAERRAAGAMPVSSTIVETVRFAQQRSKVFNNAYFVNNYGWFQGSGCTANGDVRANGDMYLDSSCKVNGRVYAARNEELDVAGNVTNYGKMDAYSTYRTSTYGTANAARPLYNDPNRDGEVNAGGYEAPATSPTTAMLKARVHANEELSIEMPYIGDLSSSSSAYREWAAELHAADSNMSTIKQGGSTIASVYYDGAGPSGDTTLADKGALVLVGTAAKPIVVNGPVVVESDVIIKGYVTGQGTIYSGRNIHIVGNVQYVNPPTWSGKSTQNSQNAQKDMLGLMAKGNIVLGDCTDASWLNSIKTYLTSQPYVQQYKCDTTDANIGYPTTFGGSYAAVEQVATSDGNAAAQIARSPSPGGVEVVGSNYQFGKVRETTVTLDTGYYVTDRWGRRTWVADTEARQVNAYDRKYYETVCDDKEITSRIETITRVDAVLYNNHGIFGKTGKCSFNGSLVCRNEGIQYAGNLYLNWDIRLCSGSAETVDNDIVGLAKASDNPPTTSAWAEVPDGLVSFD
ncbi:MAG: hypothetical protein IJ829_00575 [Kiritimatiellae bacterium]|nr:hypothetical protein [Kiritimatiellia bacterium]